MDFNASCGEDYLKDDQIDSALEDILNFKIKTLEKQRDEIKAEVVTMYKKRREENVSKEEIDKFICILLEKLELRNKWDPVIGKYVNEI